MDQSILSSKALLVRVKVGGWRASCTDDEASEIVAGQTGADAESAGRYVKKLVAKEALSDVRKVQQKARAYHETNTLPWTDNVRLLPIDKFDAYDKQMNLLSAKIQELASALANDLDKWKSEAKERLGSLYDDGDYPTPSDLQERFYISHRFEQIPDVKHFVADLADADRERVAEGMREQIAARIKGTVIDLYKRAASVTKRASEALGKGRFTKSLLNDMQELGNALPTLNLTDDPTVAKLADDFRGMLAKVNNVEQLRESTKEFNQETQNAVKDGVDQVSQKLAGYMVATE